MIIKIREQMENQKGFTLIELLIVITILGVLAAVAIPQYSSQTISVNTAKIATDLRTIDDAVSMALVEGKILGTSTAEAISGTVGILVTNNYLAAWPAPPSGSAFVNKDTEKDGKITIAPVEKEISGNYKLVKKGSNFRAELDGKYAEDYHK